MVHHNVKYRLNNIAAVKEWCKGRDKIEYDVLEDKEFRKALLRKIMINLGVTKPKGQEYINLVLGDPE